MEPVRSLFRHSIVGHVEAESGDGAVPIDTIGAGAAGGGAAGGGAADCDATSSITGSKVSWTSDLNPSNPAESAAPAWAAKGLVSEEGGRGLSR